MCAALIDCIKHRRRHHNGTRWDDIGLLSHNHHNQADAGLDDANKHLITVGPNIPYMMDNTKITRINATRTESVILGGNALE